MEKYDTCPELMECNCVKMEDKLFYFAGDANVLCSIHIKTGKVEFVDSLPDECADSPALISGIYVYKNALLCVPYMAEQIYMSDLEKGTGKDFPDIEAVRECNYYNTFVVDQYCYMFPFTGNMMLKIDLENRNVISAYDTMKIYRQFSGREYRYFSYSGCYRMGDSLYMVMRDEPVIAEFHMASSKFDFYRIAGESPAYSHLTGYRNNIYIVGSDGKIYVWNGESHTGGEVLRPELREEESERFKHSVICEKYLYLFKYIFSDEFIRINIETNQVEVISMDMLFRFNDPMNFMLMENSKFYFVSRSQMLYCIDFITGNAQQMPLSLNKTEVDSFVSARLGELDKKVEKTIQEGKYVWSLENYIKRFVKVTQNAALCQKSDIGAAIHRRSVYNEV